MDFWSFNIVSFSASAAKESLIYSYGRTFNGFAAMLSDEEVARFAGDILVQDVKTSLRMTVFLFNVHALI